MRKVIFTTALCLSAMTQLMAQNITGKVVDTKGEPLAFANVVLLNRTDSAFVKGAVSGEDGSFVIDTSCNGGIIKVTSVGYKTICKDCTGENVGIIKIEEDSKMLGEVIGIRAATSSTGRFQFSVEKVYSVKYLTPSLAASSAMMCTVSAPA